MIRLGVPLAGFVAVTCAVFVAAPAGGSTPGSGPVRAAKDLSASRVVYRLFKSCCGPPPDWLGTARLDGSDQRDLTPRPRDARATYGPVVLSPDGSEAAYVLAARGGDSLIRISLDAGGGGASTLIGSGQAGSLWPEPALWSPDGKAIAFSGGNCTASHAQLFTINADATGLRALAAIPAVFRASRPRLTITVDGWSPDGTKLLYTVTAWEGDCARYESWEGDHLYTIDADGTGRQRLLDSTSAYVRAEWSPKGDAIAVSTSPTSGFGTCYLRVINQGSASARLVSRFSGCPAAGGGFAWDPSGTAIVFGAPKTLDRIDAQTGRPSVVIKTSPYDCCWVSSDGSVIAFTTALRVETVTSTGQVIARLAPPKGTSFDHPDIHVG
jgi:WD40-like Beta Propeller Repeat